MTRVNPVAVLSVHACPFSEIGGAENGGMNVYVREVTRRMSARGVPTVVFTRKDDRGAPPEIDVPDGCRLIHIPAGPEAPLDKNSIFYHLPEFYAGVAEYARTHEVDFRLVHSHYWLSGWVGHRLGRLWGVPWVHMAHTLARVKDRERPPGAAPEPAQRSLVEQEIALECNRLIAPTAQEVEDLARLYGVGRDCVRVIPAGVDTEVFRRVPSQALRLSLGIAADEKVVVFTGRLERLKGVDVLVRAFAQLATRNPAERVRLIVLGADSSNGRLEAEGGERTRIEALARDLGVAERVMFLGAVGHDSLPAYYSLADVCVVPSYSESFGLVALEAQACQTPVVAARVGGLGQLVLDGITGRTITGHDPRDYAEAMGSLLEDPSLGAVMGVAGRQLALAYSWDITVDRLLEAYADTEFDYERAATAVFG